MGKWHGKIGYSITSEEFVIEDGKEIGTGIWKSSITERIYTGDVNTIRWKRQANESVNDEINISSTISIIADPFAYNNCYNIAYVEYLGTRWKVSDIEPSYPRLILTLGGKYDG